MITPDYVYALYSYAYSLLGLAEQGNIRYAYGGWLDGLLGLDFFHSELARPLSLLR